MRQIVIKKPRLRPGLFDYGQRLEEQEIALLPETVRREEAPFRQLAS